MAQSRLCKRGVRTEVMMPDARRRRRRTPLDQTPTTVDVAAGLEVFWDGAQRSGRLHNVPAYLAMHWQKHSWATIADEPVGAGVASNTPAGRQVQDVATTAAPCESHDLRDAGADPMGATGVPGQEGTPRNSDTFCLYGSQKIAGDMPDSSPVGVNPLLDNSFERAGQQSKPVAKAPNSRASRGVGRTGSVRVRCCPNCDEPVSGRRKWCTEACRLRAYRDRESR